MNRRSLTAQGLPMLAASLSTTASWASRGVRVHLRLLVSGTARQGFAVIGLSSRGGVEVCRMYPPFCSWHASSKKLLVGDAPMARMVTGVQPTPDFATKAVIPALGSVLPGKAQVLAAPPFPAVADWAT